VLFFIVFTTFSSLFQLIGNGHSLLPAVDSQLLLVADLVLSGELLVLAFVTQFVPLHAGSFRDLGDGHFRLRETSTVVTQPEEVGRLRTLRSIRVLLGLTM
jgi:hypothetical protein